jgi:hypothetical protein
MGQRSQIYIRHENKLVVANYYQWNYGERMISRARGIIEWIKEHSEFSFIWEDKRYMTKLSRICDTNFDMRDVVISCDIIKEWQEEFPQESFNDCVFKYQDNNDGQLFIDVKSDSSIKYALSYNPDYTKILNCENYLIEDLREDWQTPTEYLTQEDIDTCKKNIEYISANAELMTAEELYNFVNYDYQSKVEF